MGWKLPASPGASVPGEVGPQGPVGATGPAGSGSSGEFYFDAFLQTTAAVTTGVLPGGTRMGSATVLREITARVSTAPTGAPITVQLTRNGTVVGTLSIAAGLTSAIGALADVAFAQGDILNFNVTSKGSTVAGSNLAVSLSPNVVAAYTILNTPGLLMYTDMTQQAVADGAGIQTLTDVKGIYNFAASVSGEAPIFQANAFGTGLPGFTNVTARGFNTPVSPLNGLATFTFALPVMFTANLTAGAWLFGNNPQISAQVFGNDRFTWRLTTTGTGYGAAIDSPSIGLNVPKLLIFRLGGGLAELEVNGVTVNSVAFTTAIPANSSAFRIAEASTGQAGALNVKYGSAVFSNQYLTGTDLSNLRTAMGAKIGVTL